MMDIYKPGDYVVYEERQLGRVARMDGRGVFVCYTNGCTAANSPLCYLRHATEHEVRLYGDEKAKKLGHHRFDAECPDYDPASCSAFCPEKGGREC
jgi:hypothetical protein